MTKRVRRYALETTAEVTQDALLKGMPVVCTLKPFTDCENRLREPVGSGGGSGLAGYLSKDGGWWRFLGLLAFLLVLGLPGWLLSALRPGGCSGCTSCSSTHVGVLPRVVDSAGRGWDDNGTPRDVFEDGRLPEDAVISPIRRIGGKLPREDENEEGLPVIADRLNIFFKDEQSSMEAWAKDFKKLYPSDEYRIVGSDPRVHLLQLQVPPSARDQLRTLLPKQLSAYSFFVVDESIMGASEVQSAGEGQSVQHAKGLPQDWHLQAIKAPAAWALTEGKPEVVVAVVDDGIDATRAEFKGKIVKPYNIFTGDNRLSTGEGHGTSVAALAVGSGTYAQGSVRGVAPNCRLIPVQVFDNSLTTISSITSGIMYAIFAGADVVNISVGLIVPKQFRRLPLADQQKIAELLFKNQEQVVDQIVSAARSHNTILVFSAGNDAVLALVNPCCRRGGLSVNVSALSPSLERAPFTNYAKGTNISAPGEQIFSVGEGGGIEPMSGTNFSAPIVAGSIALMRSLRPSLTVEEALTVMVSTGRKLAPHVPPLLQLDQALSMVARGALPPLKRGKVPAPRLDSCVVRKIEDSSVVTSRSMGKNAQ